MRRNLLAIALAALSGLAVTTVLARTDTVPAPAFQAAALDRGPESRIEGDAAMDSAVAAAVIGAVSGQFGERKVEVKLDVVNVAPASLRDRQVTGNGLLQLGGEGAWIPFRFATLYDTSTATVSYPRLVLGDGADTDATAAGAPVTQALWTRVDAELRREFEQQPLQLALDRVSSRPAGKRYLQVAAEATVDFGDEGTTPARIEGLYDQRTGKWVRVAYELGTEPVTEGMQPLLASAD